MPRSKLSLLLPNTDVLITPRTWCMKIGKHLHTCILSFLFFFACQRKPILSHFVLWLQSLYKRILLSGDFFVRGLSQLCQEGRSPLLFRLFASGSWLTTPFTLLNACFVQFDDAVIHFPLGYSVPSELLLAVTIISHQPAPREGRRPNFSRSHNMELIAGQRAANEFQLVPRLGL